MNNTLAIIFPGQASQRVGMLTPFVSCDDALILIKETFEEASEVLGYDMWKLVQYGPIEELNKTHRAQPAILTTSVAIWRVWKDQGGCIPQIMAGHSLGEYSALVCAGSIDLSIAVRLVMVRGMLMQEAVPYGSGAMSVIIGLNDNIVYKLCKLAEQGQIVAPSCFNALQHIVISGHKEAVDRANYLCKHAGAKYVSILPISVPSHCLLMKPIIKKFMKELEKIVIRIPNISIINNTDVCITQEPQIIRRALVRQLYTPVRWSEVIKYCCVYQKILKFVEIGPGKTLTKLMRNIIDDNNIRSVSINDPVSLLKTIQNN